MPDFDSTARRRFDRRDVLRGAGLLGAALAGAACERRTGASVTVESNTAPPTTLPPTTAPAGTTPATPAAPAAPPTGTAAVMLCREAWGAAPARPGGAPQTISRLTLHHTGVVLGDNRNAPARLRGHQRLNQDERGWIDIAYHVAVDRNGNIYQLRSPSLVGDTAISYDPTGHFLLLCEGDFDQERVSEAQLDSAATVFAWAVQTYRLGTAAPAGHGDFAATACPGADLYAHLASGDLRRRIGAVLAAGPVELRTACGAEAAARVAEIEAGR